MATGITDAAETASIGNVLLLPNLRQKNTHTYFIFKTKTTVIFMFVVYVYIKYTETIKKPAENQEVHFCLCRSRNNWSGAFIHPREDYIDSPEQINLYF